ncbi:hypothetical protein VM98_35960, partial [Streptomyces rubellomurinus subsp. indigoferus]
MATSTRPHDVSTGRERSSHSPTLREMADLAGTRIAPASPPRTRCGEARSMALLAGAGVWREAPT